jgi:hypothetical protein
MGTRGGQRMNEVPGGRERSGTHSTGTGKHSKRTRVSEGGANGESGERQGWGR